MNQKYAAEKVFPAEHPPHLRHHFDTPRQQFESGRLGMWLFLATEVLLFAGLFCAYTVYRGNHPEIFVYAHRFLDANLGALNTCILLFSSLTVAWGVRAAQLGQQRLLVGLLAVTITCGAGFLSVKYVEYNHKWKHGLLWGTKYSPQVHQEEVAAPVASAEVELPAEIVAIDREERSKHPPAAIGPREMAGTPSASGARDREGGVVPDNVHLFFGIYFGMTGLHAIHLLAGMAVLTWLMIRAVRGDFGSDYFTPVDLGALYWHLVDLIWIFLFPLLYLVG